MESRGTLIISREFRGNVDYFLIAALSCELFGTLNTLDYSTYSQYRGVQGGDEQ